MRSHDGSASWGIAGFARDPPTCKSIRAAMAVVIRAALPCSYGLAVIPTADYYAAGFGGQIDGPGVRRARVIAPKHSDLIEWVKSCLELDEYNGREPVDPFSGWSPGRSVAVEVVSAVGMRMARETLYYRCMDHGRSDVRVFAALVPGCMNRWVSAWRKFLIIAWNVLQRRGLSTTRVRDLISRETGAWDSEWVRMLAGHLGDSWNMRTATNPRECMREWSSLIITRYEGELRRLCAYPVFVDEPLNVLYLVQNARPGEN